jgi:predicted phage terminase large subunit-like protein
MKKTAVADATEQLVFGPCSEKQRLILTDDTTDVLLCGGGAGGGKSHTCLTKALKYINDPAARVLIVRKTYPQLKISGGLWDEAASIYKHFRGVKKEQKMKWEFPNGATIQFAALPDDISEWQGSQLTHILVDEAAEFTEEEILFLISRLRSAKYKGHLSVTMTCNPHRDSFLYEWVKFSLDEDTGVPRPGTENIVRYFINVGGQVYWALSVEELWEKYGEPMGLVRSAPGVALKSINFLPKSFRFIPLTIYDNPILLRNNPGYLANLLSQPRVNQLRYLQGSWTAKPEGAGYFRREWVEIVDEPPINPVGRVRAWDFATSVPSETYPNPDWTVGVKMSRDRFGNYYIEDVRRFRKLVDGVLKDVIDTAKRDGTEDCKVTIPKDPGAGGKTANTFFMRTLAENGIIANSIQTSGHLSKLKRFLPFCTLAESGSVRVVKGEWNEAWFTELENFEENNRNQKDDQVDATGDAFNTLAKQIMLPDIILPSLEQKSPIPRV